MNERIRELALQAGFHWTKFGLVARFPESNPEKFAELIVRECMMVCQNTSIREDDGQTFVYSDAIQEHFRS
jgi:hypothetical protein